MKAKWMWMMGMGAGLTVCLAACQPPAAPVTGEDEVAMPVVASSARAEDGPATAWARAVQALTESRMLSPAGDNAVEHYLAARAQTPERAQAALSELQPYVLIAAEQAIARSDAPEARRLQELLERIDAQAPALPRLRAGIAALAREQVVQAAAAVLETPPPAVPGLPAAARTGSPPAAPVIAVAPPEVPAVAADPPPLATPAVAAGAPRPANVPAASPATPRLLQDAQPRYPLPALRARIEGQADVAFTIQPDGSVRDARVLSSTPAGMFEASALAVAQRWRFEATGQAHASRRTLRFRLPVAQAGDG